MHVFKDTNGKTWTLEITVAAVRRVRGLAGVDLLALVRDGFAPLAELVGDPIRLCDVLWCLVQPQAERDRISDEDFGRALAGDAIAHAAEAFVEELIDFFPDAKARSNLRRALGKAREVADLIHARGAKELEQLDPETLARTFIDSSGSSPASSAVTRPRLHSPSS